MRILLSWLGEFVDVTVGVQELGQMLSMRGYEVAAIEPWPVGPPAPNAPRPATDDEAVIDLEITPNRPDCLSVVGIAREVATAYNLPLRTDHLTVPYPTDGGAPSRLQVTLDDAELCPRYAASVADVRIAPSPTWLANRLRAAGIRPINNVVDASNYVLMEIGHPTHAFDLQTLAGSELVIRRARAGERLVTLDGVDRTLEADMLVIADKERAQALAGIMGGAGSEVSSSTRTVALESAYFNPISVRRTSKRIGLKTEASTRFERGADIEAPVTALARLANLFQQIGAGQVTGSIIDRYPVTRLAVRVPLRRTRIARVLGQEIPDTTVARIFAGLGFEVAPLEERSQAAPQAVPASGVASSKPESSSANGAGWLVTVPTWRVDLARETDLIEEVARHFGYDRLPATFPALTTMPARPRPAAERAAALRRVLAAAGFSEAMTFAFIEAAAAAPFTEREPIAIAYPLSEKFAVLRPSLLPGLIDGVSHNARRGRRDVRLFEMGATFSDDKGEQPKVAIAWAGAGSVEHWSARAREVDLFDVKGVIERIGQALEMEIRFEPTSRPYLVEGRTASVRSGPDEFGVMGQVAPALAVARSLPASDVVYIAELDLTSVWTLPFHETHVQSIPRHPSVVRDLSILVSNRLPAAEVRGTIFAAAPPTLVDVREFDRYSGKGISEGRVSLSFHLTFRSPERTLTDAEVQEAMDAIVTALGDRHDAVRR